MPGISNLRDIAAEEHQSRTDASGDDYGWHYEAPRVDPHADKLTLALLEDLSNALVLHGYPSVRGIALWQIIRAIAHLDHGG